MNDSNHRVNSRMRATRGIQRDGAWGDDLKSLTLVKSFSKIEKGGLGNTSSDIHMIIYAAF